MYTLGELADRLDLTFTGDAHKTLTRLAPLDAAGPGELSFLADRAYLPRLAGTGAGAVILYPDLVAQCPVDCLSSDDPYLAFARASQLFAPADPARAGIHPTAVVDAAAEVDDSVMVGPGAVIEAGARVGAGARLDAGAFLGRDSRLGAGTRLHPGAVIYHDVQLGRNCTVHGRAVIGADGFGFARGPDGWEKIHQQGGVRIGDGVEIGAGTTVDRGTLAHTVIADGVIIDNLVQIGHNCRIGPRTAIAGCCGLAGSSVIGADCALGGGVGVVGHVEICDNVRVTAMTMVTRSITQPGSYSSGTPLAPTGEWKRSAVRFAQLDDLQRRIVSLERQGKNPGAG